MSERSEYFRARRARLRADRKCIQCRAGLMDGDGVRCLECSEAHRHDERARWHEPGYQRRQSARRARRMRDLVAKRLCTCCGKAAPTDDRAWCDGCLQRNKVYAVLGAGITRLPARRAPSRTEPRYVPLDEIERNNRVRLLRALWWLGWVDTRELFDAAGVDSDPRSVDRNGAQVALGRLVKYGLVEKREGRAVKALVGLTSSWADYRITAAGRAEVANYRRGVYPVQRGRRRAA